MKHTPKTHPEFEEILSSQTKINVVVDNINRTQDILQNRKKLESIKDSLEGLEVCWIIHSFSIILSQIFELVKPQRRYISDWNVKKHSNGSDYTLILLSDIFLITKPKKDKLKLKSKIYLNKLRIVNVAEKGKRFFIYYFKKVFRSPTCF
jgi:hypothetical protein